MRRRHGRTVHDRVHGHRQPLRGAGEPLLPDRAELDRVALAALGNNRYSGGSRARRSGPPSSTTCGPDAAQNAGTDPPGAPTASWWRTRLRSSPTMSRRPRLDARVPGEPGDRRNLGARGSRTDREQQQSKPHLPAGRRSHAGPGRELLRHRERRARGAPGIRTWTAGARPSSRPSSTSPGRTRRSSATGAITRTSRARAPEPTMCSRGHLLGRWNHMVAARAGRPRERAPVARVRAGDPLCGHAHEPDAAPLHRCDQNLTGITEALIDDVYIGASISAPRRSGGDGARRRFRLAAAQPNPFNPATLVTYETVARTGSSSAYTTSRVGSCARSSTGRRAGVHTALFDGRDAAGRISRAGPTSSASSRPASARRRR